MQLILSLQIILVNIGLSVVSDAGPASPLVLLPHGGALQVLPSGAVCLLLPSLRTTA